MDDTINTSSDTAATRFFEVQYFYQNPLSWLVWMITAIAIGILAQNGMIYDIFAAVVMVILAGVLVLVSLTNLRTEVSEEGVSYQMKPFHSSMRTLRWEELSHAEVRKYHPVREYGGWGVRIGLGGKAYNVKGNMGLQIVSNSGKRILLGTQKPDELREVLLALNK